MSSVSESVRRILSEYEFELDNPDLTCILCKKIMIDAYQSFCGCIYCQRCITNYLSGERKYCVGDKEDCNEEYLFLDKNVTINPRINNLILKLKIRCPNQSCTFETELNQMENHLQLCAERPISCPFLNIGCINERRSKNEVLNHMHKEELTHANMLKEFVENLKEEIMSLKEDSRRKEIQVKEIIEEISILKVSLNNKEEMIESQRIDLETLRYDLLKERENIIQIKELVDFVKYKEIINIQETLNKKEMAILEIKRRIEEHRTEIYGLKDEAGRRESEFEVMKGELDKMRETLKKTMMEEEAENVKREIEKKDLREEMEDQKKRLNGLRENQENIVREIRSIIERVRDSRVYDEREFTWRVDNFSKMKNGLWRKIILWKYSRKFDLGVRCAGDNFRFTCRIMKGQFDDYVSWPMKHKIRLSLINQDTMEVHKCEEYRYDTFIHKSAFNKPSWEWNRYIGDDSFTSLKDLKDTPGLLSQDSLIVSFTIDCQ